MDNTTRPLTKPERSAIQTLAQLAKAIVAEHTAAKMSAKVTLEHAIRCGELLIQAKRQCRHGNFEAWASEHCNMSKSAYTGYMRLAKRQAELPDDEDLGIREAIRFLAAPRSSTARAEAKVQPSDVAEAKAQVAKAASSLGGSNVQPVAPLPEPAQGEVQQVQEPEEPEQPDEPETPRPIPAINPQGGRFCGKVIWPRQPSLYDPVITERDVIVAYNLAQAWTRTLATAKPESPYVIARMLRHVCRDAERASSLKGLLHVFEECINAYDKAGGDTTDSKSPGIMSMIDTADKKAERRADARRRYAARKAAGGTDSPLYEMVRTRSGGLVDQPVRKRAHDDDAGGLDFEGFGKMARGLAAGIVGKLEIDELRDWAKTIEFDRLYMHMAKAGAHAPASSLSERCLQSFLKGKPGNDHVRAALRQVRADLADYE